MNYYNFLYNYEKERITKFMELLNSKYNLRNININDLIVCMCNSARIKELGLNPMTTFASPGDKLLDFVIYHNEVEKDFNVSKGSLDNLRQKSTKKENQYYLMIELGFVNYILNGNCQTLNHYIKYSVHPISDQFEAFIYVLFKNLGLESIETFLSQIGLINNQ